MSILAQEEQGGSAVRRISQEVQKSAHERYHCLVAIKSIYCIDWVKFGFVSLSSAVERKDWWQM